MFRITVVSTMIFVPLPFVVALLLFILLIQMIRRREVTVLNPFFFSLIAAYALQSMVIGLRWGYDLRGVLPVQAVLAAAIASLAWLSFEGLRTGRSPLKRPLLCCTRSRHCLWRRWSRSGRHRSLSRSF